MNEQGEIRFSHVDNHGTNLLLIRLKFGRQTKRRKTMKRANIMRTIGVGVSLVLLISGCAKSDTNTLPDFSTPIDFTPLVTRAAVTSLGEGDSFAVWARESSDGTSQQILTQEEVHCSNGTWSYNNLRYWKLGKTYDFYALYPHDTPNAGLQNSLSGETPQIIVTNFDTRNAVDLMTAEHAGILYTGNPSPVIFTFRHLLSQVEIIGRIDPALTAAGVSVRLVSASFHGMPATGSCTISPGTFGTWNLGPATTAASPFVSSEELALSETGTSVFNEMLTFPQPVSDVLQLDLVYEYTDANYTVNRFSKSIRLADAGITEWQPSTGYRYTFTIGNEYILFEKPDVLPWRSASGGIITVE